MMQNKKLLDLTDLEVYKLWLNAKKEVSRKEFANSLGLSQKALDSRLYRGKKEYKGEYKKEPMKKIQIENNVQKEEDGNNLTLDSLSTQIITLEQLLETCKVDLEEWRIDKWILNKWDGYRRKEVKHLEWSNGRIQEGEIIDDGDLTIEPLFQIKVWLIKRNPEPIIPCISPVEIHIPLRQYPQIPKVKLLHRALIIGDMHFGFKREIHTGKLDPFHSRNVINITLQIAQQEQPDIIIFLGDCLDLLEWSNGFLTSPEFYWTTQPAIVELAWWLAQFRQSVPYAEIKKLEGNHDNRLEKSIATHLISAYQLKSVAELELPPALSVPKLLDLHTLDIEWIGDYPNGEIWLNDELVCKHGDIARQQSGSTTSVAVSNEDVSQIFGHIHRLEMATRSLHTRYGVRTLTTFSPGCVCRIDGIVPGKRAKQNWQNGCAMVEFDQKSFFTITPIPINGNIAIYDGIVYQAQDRLERIKEETNWDF